MRARFRVLVGAALIGLVTSVSLVVVSPASASPRVFSQRTVSETVRVHSLQYQAVYPTCGEGEVATGGGFHVAGTTDPSAYTVLVSAPLDNGWNVQLQLGAAVSYIDLTAYVVCLTKVVGNPQLEPRIVTVASQAFRNSPASVGPRCGKGELVTGGGYSVGSINPTAYTVYVNEPYQSNWGVPPTNGWNVQVYSTHAPYTHIWGYAVCVKIPNDVSVWHQIVTASGHAYGQTPAGVTSRCQLKTASATGGGFSVGSTHPATYTVMASVPGRTSWQAEVFYDEQPADHLTIRSSNVCLGNT